MYAHFADVFYLKYKTMCLSFEYMHQQKLSGHICLYVGWTYLSNYHKRDDQLEMTNNLTSSLETYTMQSNKL